ncbi:OmpA family protein [Amycolatopsis vastitatis]|nr:OmpA family protein [Amycolatopsis vastitatis]
MMRIIALVIAAAVAASTLSACVSAKQAACGDNTVTATPSDGQTVVLIDASNSVRADGKGGTAPDYADALKDAIAAAVARNDFVTVGTFDGSPSTVDFPTENYVTKSTRNNEGHQTEDAQTARTCLANALKAALAQEPKSSGSDILAAVDMAREKLAKSTGPKTIVIATDGVPTTGCADLTHVTIGDQASIERVVENCRPSLRLRPNLNGITLEMIGIGRSASDLSQPTYVQLSWLQDLWSKLCEVLKTKEACSVSTAPIKSGTDRRRGTEQKSADPVVKYPPDDEGYKTANGGVAFTLSADALFSPNSDRIKRDAEASLVGIAQQIAGRKDTHVDVNGYTEAQADEQLNLDLATRRANAVKNWLNAHGVTGTAAHGSAGTAPNCHPKPQNDTERQCNRRVDIVATK